MRLLQNARFMARCKGIRAAVRYFFRASLV